MPTARAFMFGLASRLSNRVQLTSDSHGAYLRAVEGAFGNEIDYAQLQKLYGETANQRSAIALLNASAVSGKN